MDYSYRQNGQLGQMGKSSHHHSKKITHFKSSLSSAGQSWGVPEELGGYPAHMGMVAQAPHHIQVILYQGPPQMILLENNDNDNNRNGDNFDLLQGPPQMHQPVARRPITGSVGNYYPQVSNPWTFYLLDCIPFIVHYYSLVSFPFYINIPQYWVISIFVINLSRNI